MRRAWPWAGAGLLLALALWWAWPQPAPRPAPGTTSAEAARVPSPGAAAPVAAPADGEVSLELLLLPDGAVAARTDGIRLGLAQVPEDARRRWESWQAGGSEGAGPARYEELAEVVEWRTLAGVVQADGTVRVAARLPRADRYELQARGDSPLHYYSATFGPRSVPARVAPSVAAGLRVTGVQAGAQLLLRREPGGDADPRWQALLAREAPELLAAYDEQAWPLAEGELLAPLPPGPLQAVLLVRGVEAERRPLVLIAGRVTVVRFEALPQDVARALSARVELEFVQAGSDEPLAGLDVTWHGERGDLRQRSDGAGRVEFAPVDRQRPLRLSLDFPQLPAEPLPRWPAARALEVSLDDAVPLEADGRLRKRIELAPLRWLRVRAGAPLQPFHRGGADPYPIFVLQREQAGAWRNAAADSFLSQPDGLAVSLEAAGRYRLMALQSPWSVRWSDAAELHDADAVSPAAVALLPAAGRRVEVSVLHRGRPLARAPLHLLGPATGLPPRVLTSDEDGRVRLDAVTVPTITLEVTGYQPARVDLQGSVATVELVREGAPPEG